jgi:DNA-binding response OmpR family regulator
MDRRRVLVASAQREVGDLCAVHLRRLGAVPTVVHDGRAARALLRGRPPFALLVLDESLEQPSSRELLAEIEYSASLQCLPVVVVAHDGQLELPVHRAWVSVMHGPEDLRGLRLVIDDLDRLEQLAHIHRTFRREMARAHALCQKTAALTASLGRNRRRP